MGENGPGGPPEGWLVSREQGPPGYDRLRFAYMDGKAIEVLQPHSTRGQVTERHLAAMLRERLPAPRETRHV